MHSRSQLWNAILVSQLSNMVHALQGYGPDCMITSSTWLVYEPPLASRETVVTLRETLEFTRQIFQQMRPAIVSLDV